MNPLRLYAIGATAWAAFCVAAALLVTMWRAAP